MTPRRVLILGGTVEAAQLAAILDADPNFDPITSLAGRTRSPAPVPGIVRAGGFGGPEGLTRYIIEEAIDLLVDATHPFAEQITRHAAVAAELSDLPRLRLERPAWSRHPDDQWIEVSDIDHAVLGLPSGTRRVFLSIGRQDLAPFTDRDGVWFLLRMIDQRSTPPGLANCTCVFGRGPFAVDAEIGLLREHHIDTVVSKNSGGEATYGKIVAARRLGLPIVMIRRPAAPPGDRAESVGEALDWLRRAGLS